MNTTNITSTVAPLITFLAGLLAGKGVFGLDAGTWTTVLGSAAAFGATIWAAISTRKTAQIAAVAQMPEVKEVKLEQSAPADLVAATPANVTK